jgi:hypothetical protein
MAACCSVQGARESAPAQLVHGLGLLVEKIEQCGGDLAEQVLECGGPRVSPISFRAAIV